MLGFYVHIPFCARRCPYCDFAVQIGGGAALRNDYVAALRREIEAALREQISSEPGRALTSIYFGGGTPTELEATDLAELLKLIFDGIKLAPDAEITIEANPENLSKAKLAALDPVERNAVTDVGAPS